MNVNTNSQFSPFIYFRNTTLIINGCHFLLTSSIPTMRSMVSIRPWLASIQIQSTSFVFVWGPKNLMSPWKWLTNYGNYFAFFLQSPGNFKDSENFQLKPQFLGKMFQLCLKIDDATLNFSWAPQTLSTLPFLPFSPLGTIIILFWFLLR